MPVQYSVLFHLFIGLYHLLKEISVLFSFCFVLRRLLREISVLFYLSFGLHRLLKEGFFSFNLCFASLVHSCLPRRETEPRRSSGGLRNQNNKLEGAKILLTAEGKWSSSRPAVRQTASEARRAPGHHQAHRAKSSQSQAKQVQAKEGTDHN